MDASKPKPLVWVGSSRKDFREFPEQMRAEMGYGLFQAQLGLRRRSAKTLAGFAALARRHTTGARRDE